jgi:hypothetical protein
MAIEAQLADGRILEFPDGTDPSVIQATVKRIVAQSSGPKQSTIGSELVRGAKQALSSGRTGFGSIFDPNEAARAGVARSEAIGQEAGEGVSLEAVKKAYRDKGLLSAAGEAVSQVPRALAGQGANLASMYAGAKAGSAAGSAFGVPGRAIGAGLGAGAVLLPQFMGSNVERQAAEQMEEGKAVDVNRTKAYSAALGQAALEGAGTAFTLGKRVVGGILGLTDDVALKSVAAQAELVKAAERSLAASAGRGVVRGAAEMPVEVAQQILERYQAGLELTSPDAYKEYGESAYQAALIGGPLGGVAGAAERGQARGQLDQQRRAEEAARPREPEPEQAPEQEIVPGAKLRQDARVGTQGTLFTRKEMGDKIAEPKETPEPKVAAVQQGEQLGLGLDFQRDYNDLVAEREALRAGPRTAEARARIAELTEQMASYDEATAGLSQAEEIIKAERAAKKAKTAVAEPVVTGITQADIDAIGLPLRTSKQWVQDNVLGKTVEEIQALVQRDPKLISGKGARAEVLKALIAPQPTAFEEKPNVPTTTQTDQPQGELDLGGGKPSVGVPSEPAGTNVVQPGAGVPAPTGTSETPDGLGLAPAGQPVSEGTTPQGTQPTAVATPTARTSDQVQDEIRALQTEQQALLTKAGRVPAVKSPARVKWDTLGEQITQKKAEWDSIDQTERKAKNAPTTTPAAPSPAAPTTTAKGPKTTAKPTAKVTPPKETKAPAPAVATETVDEEAARKAEAEDFKRRLEEVERKQKAALAKADAARNIPSPKVTPTKKPVVETAPAPEIEPEVVSPFAAIAKYKEQKAQAEAAIKNKPNAEISYAERTTLSEATLQDHIAQGKTREALQSILSAPTGLYNELDRAVARRMLLSGSLPTVQVVPEGSLGKAEDGKVVAGQYDAETDDIKLADGYVGALTFLHELVHGFTHRAIVSHTSGETNNAGVRALQELYDHVKKVNPGAVKEYGMTDLSEFAAEAMANQKFQAILQKIPYRRTNAFTEFARRVLQVLGLAPTDTHTALAATMISVDSIMTEGRRTQVAKTGTSVAEGATNKPMAVTYSTEALVDSMGPLSRDEESSLKRLIAGVQSSPDIGYVTKFRTQVTDIAATIEKRLSDKFDGAVRNSLGELNPMGLYRQAQDYTKMLLEYFQTGTLYKDPTTGLWKSGMGEGVRPPAEVFALIDKYAEKNGYSRERATQIASRVLEGVRLNEMRRSNRQDGTSFVIHLKDNEIDQLVAEYNADPDLKEMSKLMDEARKAMVDNMVKVGRLSAEEGKLWREVVGYVPFDRETIDAVASNFNKAKKISGKGLAQLGKLPELVGSLKRPVGNVFENYLNTLGWMVGQTLKSDATLQTLKSLQDVGYAKKLGVSAQGNPNVVGAYVDGEMVYWSVPSKYDVMAFKDLNPPKAGWLRLLGAFSNILRKAVTALPPFALKQVTDDVQRAILTSGVKNPGALIWMSLTNFPKLALAELRGIQHPMVRDFGKLGLTGEYDFEAGKPAASLLKDLGYKKRGRFESLLHKLDGITRASDLAVRKAIYDQTLKESGDALLAQTRAREFINFRRRGANDFVGAMVTTIPFFNAYIQGMDVLYRAASGKDSSSSVDRAQARQLFWSRAAIATTFSMMYALGKDDDDEDYNNMDLRTRDSNWILPGGYKLPVPGELGAIFKVIPERVVEYMKRQGTPEEQTAFEAMRTTLSYMFEQYLGRAVPVPQAIKPVLEAWANKSFLTGKDLEGYHHRAMDPSMRMTEQTSELAKAIAVFSRDEIGVEVSPIMVDNALRGYLGSTAAMFTMVTDSLLNPTRVDRPLHKYALLSNYLYDPVGTRRMTEFYEEREKVGKANTTLNELMKTDIARAEKYVDEHADELQLEGAVNSTLEQLERTRAYRKFLNSPDGAEEMSKEDREAELKEIKKVELELVSWVREAKAELRKVQR